MGLSGRIEPKRVSGRLAGRIVGFLGLRRLGCKGVNSLYKLTMVEGLNLIGREVESVACYHDSSFATLNGESVSFS